MRVKMNKEQRELHKRCKNKPNWYGIKNIKFIFHNEWSDPEIEYYGRIIDSYVVEDTMWERFNEDINLGYIEVGKECSFEMDNAFEKYMKDYSDDVIELILLACGELEY